MSAAADYRTTFSVDPAHPALPGHFPGRPLVPGVVMLEQVARALRDWRGERLARIVDAKFVAPLAPGVPAELTLAEAAGRLRFEIRHDGGLLARGTLEAAPG